MTYIEELGKKVKEAKAAIAIAPSAEKNRVLLAISQKLRDHCQVILEANQKDIKAANDNGISGTMIDRLSLNEQRINAIADAVVELTALADPVGVIKSGKVLPNGLRLSQVTVPLGAIGIIYESRPNVTVDAAVMCLKSGNAVMLRGGKEAFHTNQCLVRLMREALQEEGFPSDLIVLVEDTSRETATQMMRLNGMLDVLIPRGGAGLIQSVVKNATLPVIETGTGNCHVYVDASAKIDMAISIVYNAKTSRPSVCNAEESLLVHKSIAKEFLPRLKEALDRKHVILHGCPETIAILGKDVLPATEEDYSKEYLDYEMSVKVVEDISEAIMHIAKYSTGHSDAIVTENYANAQQFIQQVDSAAVYVNASTRFTDGGEFGFGAEIGISTQKLHARGPMGLEALTSSKYVVLGSGQIRE